MKKVIFFIFCFISFIYTYAQEIRLYDPNHYILIDPRMIRGSLGYTNMKIKDVAGIPDRIGHGFNTRFEVRFLSWILKRQHGFVLTDGMNVDLSIGYMSTEPIKYYNSPESKFASSLRFGYSVMSGYSNRRIGLLGGKNFEWLSSFIGGSFFPGDKLILGTAPWIMRLEFRPAFSNEFRLMVTGWDNFTHDRTNKGFRVELPIKPKKRLFICYENIFFKTQVSSAAFDNNVYAPGILNLQNIGLKYGAIY
jgi:hypothetical protein